MDTKADELKTKIANCKRKITNFAKFIEGYSADRDFPTLEKRTNDLDREFEEFNILYTELEVLVNDPTHEESHTDYEEKFYIAFGKAKAYINEYNANQHHPSSSRNTGRKILTDSVRNTKKNLPRVNLPTFSGSYEAWLGFHDLFKSLVDNNDDLPNIETLYHLKGSLKDETGEIIASLELSSENYIVAWELLKERYDNRTIIRQTHVKALLNLPYLSKDFPVRFLVDQIQKHVRALEALKEPIDKWDTLLVEIIKQKLSSFIREKWEDSSCESESPTYKELIYFLQRRAQLEDPKSGQIQGKPLNVSDKKLSRSQFSHHSQQAFVASTAIPPCPHCQGEHPIYVCVLIIVLLTARAVLVVIVAKCITHCYISRNDRLVSVSKLHLSIRIHRSLICMLIFRPRAC
ncbi:uncharacterized protein LOC117176569 [Belonocnema kinseyi]|uniref:uncharacterized protein LOC117176569 n=1 Tax=Belonocnema kinseyi TaxID=2817044 RepID=UPI00143D33B3|nr:uncharacterized protein LOC117176569 [Belonocnema kinseyi]